MEALAAGKPVVAFRGGDVVEHIEEGKSGIFFEHQTVADIMTAVKKLDSLDYDPEYNREKARKFDKSVFKAKIKEYISSEYMDFKNRLAG